MSNKWYRRIIATAATAAAGTVAFAAPATADEATVTTDPCNPGTVIVIEGPPSDGLTPEELEDVLDQYDDDDPQDGSGGDDGFIDIVDPGPDGNVYTGDIEIVITDPSEPIDVWEVAHASAFTAATCGTDDPGVTPEDPDDTDTDPGAVFGSLESVSFGSLEQILGLMTD